MKNKIIRLSALVVICLVVLASCTDYLDINKDPRYPEKAATNLLVSSGITWSAARLGRDAQLVGSMWSQHYTQNNSSNQYKPIDSYNMTNNSTEITALWSSFYSGALPDFKIAISQAETNGEWNYWVAAKVMTAFDFHVMASFFETIPLTEALEGENLLSPVYDESHSVDAAIISLLDAAIAKKSEAKALASMSTNDFVFGGNIDNWIKFAKTLKLKILIRDFDNNTAAIQSLLTENDFLTTDATLTQFTDAENYSNPLYESDRRKLNTANNIRLSATLASYLISNNDPRIASIGETVTKNIDGSDAPANTYRGLDQGTADYYTQIMFPSDAHSRARLAATDPVYFMSAAESYFLQAEAYARLNDAGNAKAKYDLGVTAAFTRWGFGTTAATFIAAGNAYEFNAGDQNAMLTSILTQKWVAAARCQAWDAFFDICRTGIPALGTQYVNNIQDPSQGNPLYVVGTLTPSYYSVLAAGSFPCRYTIPKNSSDYNTNAPKASDYPITKKMWWHK